MRITPVISLYFFLIEKNGGKGYEIQCQVCEFFLRWTLFFTYIYREKPPKRNLLGSK